MSQKREKSDAQILAQLKRRKSPATATELGLNSRGGAERLRKLQGVTEVERRQTGKAGRPAAQFVYAGPREVLSDPSVTATQAELAAADKANAELAVGRDSQSADVRDRGELVGEA